ncbi:Pectinesterase, partial [Thalictrum thalictroides]
MVVRRVTYMAAQAILLTTIFFINIPNKVIADTLADEKIAYQTMPVSLSNEFSTIPTGLLAADSALTSQLIKVPGGGIDPALAEAEKAPKIIKVRQDGSGEFKTITDAIKSIPSGNKVRTIVSIGPGEYKEKIKVDRFKPFVTFYGTDPGNMPKISFGDTAKTHGTWNSATTIVESDYFVAVNIIFTNTELRSVAKSGYSFVAAHGMQSQTEDNGFTFVRCNLTGTGDMYLARTWKAAAKIVFAYSYLGPNINPAGWFNNKPELRNG